MRGALEQAGWRYTRQRAAVFDYLCSVESHPTAEEVYLTVRRRLPKISLATVYKALEALVDCHLADKLTHRADDTKEAVDKRIAKYHSETAPIIPFYLEKGILKRVDGVGDPNVITDRIKAVLNS